MLSKNTTMNLEHCFRTLDKPHLKADDISTILFFVQEALAEQVDRARAQEGENRDLLAQLQSLQSALQTERDSRAHTTDSAVCNIPSTLLPISFCPSFARGLYHTVPMAPLFEGSGSHARSVEVFMHILSILSPTPPSVTAACGPAPIHGTPHESEKQGACARLCFLPLSFPHSHNLLFFSYFLCVLRC